MVMVVGVGGVVNLADVVCAAEFIYSIEYIILYGIRMILVDLKVNLRGWR